MEAVIMAGGRGSRLAPYTTVLPKPLMPLEDRPILDVLLHQLVGAGVERITISVGHLGALIESWARHSGEWPISIDFVYEHEPLGTAGALKQIRRPSGVFLALNGDILTTLDFAELASLQQADTAVATVATNVRTVDVQYGVVHTDHRGRVTELEEKPQLRYTVSMGIYAMHPRIIDLIDEGEAIDFPHLLSRAQARGEEIGTLEYDGYWRDIGNAEDYRQAINDFSEQPSRFIPADG